MTVYKKIIKNYMVARVLNSEYFLPGCVGGIYLYETKTSNVAAFILVFSSSVEALPPAEMDSSGMLWLSMYDAEYMALVDLLRNEKPLLLEYNDTTQHAVIETLIEPVGEGEIASIMVKLLKQRKRKKTPKPIKRH
jgi:hypothetical protein